MTNVSDLIYEEARQIKALDCDFQQQLKPAALLQHLSEVAGAHATHMGAGFEAVVAQGLLWVHARMKIRFYRFPTLDDPVTIRTWAKGIERRLLYMRDFEVLDANGKHLAAATSAWLIIDGATHRIVRPESLDLKLPTVESRVGLDEPLERIRLDASSWKPGEERLGVRAGYSAVDVLGHVNNSRYVEWICDAFSLAVFKAHQPDWLQINYTHEVLPEEEVSILVHRSARDPALWAVLGLNRTNDTRAFEALLRWRD